MAVSRLRSDAMGLQGIATNGSTTEELDTTHQLLLDSARLFIRNLAFSITEVDLRALLEPFGELLQVSLPFQGQLFKG